MVEHDLTMAMFSSFTHSILLRRHRASQTLFVSPLLLTAKGTGPPFLPLAAVGMITDALDGWELRNPVPTNLEIPDSEHLSTEQMAEVSSHVAALDSSEKDAAPDAEHRILLLARRSLVHQPAL